MQDDPALRSLIHYTKGEVISCPMAVTFSSPARAPPSSSVHTSLFRDVRFFRFSATGFKLNSSTLPATDAGTLALTLTPASS